ncbi:MAG: bacillithiol system redox-active protein YtxJ [Bacteroidetes bacterium]|nr:MAG: bacillithiol system redox-active protein YtxJ [Bacteroidota bacterium]
MTPWIKLDSMETLENLPNLSQEQDILIFKHSTTCSTSAAAFNRLNKRWEETKAKHLKPYYLDLLANRNISNEITKMFAVKHESPQILIIRKGKCVYHISHLGIDFDSLISV